MGAGKRSPQVAPVGAGRRVVELVKDVVIVALTCSAVYLASLTPMALQLRSWMAPPPAAAPVQLRQARESLVPWAVAVRSSLGLYGVSYNDAQVEEAFSLLSPLLGEALTTAGAPETMAVRQWRQMMDRPGVFCQFEGRVPLGALGAWLGERDDLEGAAQSLLLSWDGQKVWLCWQDGGSSFRAETQVEYRGRMSPVLEEFTPNGAAFVYTLRESDKTYDALDPNMLVASAGQWPGLYAASAPDFTGEEALGTLLESLRFRSGVGSAYEAAGEMAINEGGDRLRVNADGRVVFHAGDEVRYPVSAAGERATVQEAALACWEVLNRAAESWKGETAYVLTGTEERGDGWTVTFHARLKGIPVYTGSEGWCAQFTVEEGRIADFTLVLRSYTATGETAPVPSERLAAAALRAKNGAGRLVLCYSDNGSGGLSAGWMAVE